MATVSLLAGPSEQQSESDLYAQATAVMLDRSFPSPEVNYVVLDVRTRRTIAIRWPIPEMGIPPGSLLKPFVALAYSTLHAGNGSHADRFPTIVCHGKSDGCWRTGGHGALQLEHALAKSCNAYFLALARDVSRAGTDALDRVAREYGLPIAPRLDDSVSAESKLIGVTPEWRVQPLALAQAYATLATQSRDEVTARLLAGMKLAAMPGGTAARVGIHPGGVLAKTGTAPCVASTDRCIVNGDGLVLVLAPAESPRLLLLVRRRGTTGAMTAEWAGRMLTKMEEAHAFSSR
jgi:cell division protein FtsI/penicillin-binding protein 2